MRQTVAISSILFVLAAAAVMLHSGPEGEQLAVLSVHDGDSLRVRLTDCKSVAVRLYGVDCPELGQPYGEAAAGELLCVPRAARAGGARLPWLCCQTDAHCRRRWSVPVWRGLMTAFAAARSATICGRRSPVPEQLGAGSGQMMPPCHRGSGAR